MARFCPLFSSSSGNCIFVGGSGGGILIDAGVSAKRIKTALAAQGIDLSSIAAIFVTHEHSDHIAGLRVLAGTHHIDVYASAGTLDALEDMDVLNDKYTARPVPYSGMEIGGMFVRPFPISHDVREGVGYSVMTADGRRACVVTDTGVITPEILSATQGSDLVMIESNHDIRMLENGPYPYYLKRRILSSRGHLSNDACAETVTKLLESGSTRFLLGHLSRENNFPLLAAETSRSALTLQGATEGRDYLLQVVGGVDDVPEMTIF